MKFYRRVCRVLADEGVSGFARTVARKVSRRGTQPPSTSSDHTALIAEAKREHERAAQSFKEWASRQADADLDRYYWYHTIDLGGGVVTPGDYDYRPVLRHFPFPDDMRGMTVLDVGSATGFFAFEFERRGATVTSVELPSIADWDMPLGRHREETLKELMLFHRAGTVEEATRLHLHGPFEFCRKALNSNVRRCYSTVYDLSPRKLGADSFDLIFVGDVLAHTFSPFRALCALAPLCRGTLVVADVLWDTHDRRPVLVFLGGDWDSRSWFHASRECLFQMLERLEFRDVSVFDRYQTVERRSGIIYNRGTLRARK